LNAPKKHIAIIGAGAAGLFAAEQLAQAGCRVTIYDQMPSPARKFLLAGRGGLNLTHSEPLEQFLTRYGAAEAWLAPIIHAFPPEALRTWCDDLGEETFIGSSGRIFPKSMKAAPLLRAWLRRLESLGVMLHTRHRWQGWKDNKLHFTNAHHESVFVTPDATLLTLGGASWPRLGSDGGWVDILYAKGVEIAPLKPANCGFALTWSAYFRDRFAGTPLKSIALTHQNRTHQGEAMITANGIEGGAIYALSASLRDAIEKNGSTHIYLDLRPNMTLSALTQKLSAKRGSKSFSTGLRGAGFSPLAIALLHETTPPEQLHKASGELLATQLKSIPLTLTATAGISRAISSAGGITQSSVNNDFMLNNLSSIFVAGEMLDWEAPTGGYLLQACFSSAFASAKGILRYLNAI
jgi:uncharacterized flavoprotein (TIGR03862 family)